MVDVNPMFRVTVDCPCGCGLHGTARPRAWSDGLDPHVRSCACKRCSGGRQRGIARRREDKVAKAVGGTRDSRSGGLSGVDVRSLVVEIEETANKSLVAGVRRWWESKQIIAKRERLWSRTHSDAEPVFVASWDGKPQLAVLEFDSFARLARQAQALGEYET